MAVGETPILFSLPPTTPEDLVTGRLIKMDHNTLYRVDGPAHREALIAALAAGTV
jgi:hypothetical protein